MTVLADTTAVLADSTVVTADAGVSTDAGIDGDGFFGDGFLYDEVTDSFVAVPPPTGLLILQDAETPSAAANTLITAVALTNYAVAWGKTIAATYTTLQIEQAILRAMDRFERYEGQFFGQRSTAVQQTAFPRTGHWQGFSRQNAIPRDAQKAVAAFAILEIARDPTQVFNTGEQSIIAKRREKAGPVEREYQYITPAQQETITSEAMALVEKLYSTKPTGGGYWV